MGIFAPPPMPAVPPPPPLPPAANPPSYATGTSLAGTAMRDRGLKPRGGTDLTTGTPGAGENAGTAKPQLGRNI